MPAWAKVMLRANRQALGSERFSSIICYVPLVCKLADDLRPEYTVLCDLRTQRLSIPTDVIEILTVGWWDDHVYGCSTDAPE